MRKPPKIIEHLIGFFSELFKLIGKIIKWFLDEGQGKPDNGYYPYLLVGLVDNRMDKDVARERFSELQSSFNSLYLCDINPNNGIACYNFLVNYKEPLDYDFYKLIRSKVKIVIMKWCNYLCVVPMQDLDNYFSVKMMEKSDKLFVYIAFTSNSVENTMNFNSSRDKYYLLDNVKTNNKDIEKDWGEE